MTNLIKTAIAVLFTGLVFSQNGNFANGGFENWSQHNLFEYPSQWNTTNVYVQPEIAPIKRTTDAQHGSYAAEINTIVLEQDTISGYIYQGDFSGLPQKGIPYSDLFNEIRIYYKCDLAPEDTLVISMTRFNGGVIVDEAVIPIGTGITNTYTEAILPVTSTQQDSLIIDITIGDPTVYGVPTLGSWGIVDNIRLYYNGSQVSDLPDPSFEDWTTATSEEPDNWFTLNQLIPYISGSVVTKSTDANTGSYAAQMTTINHPFANQTIGAYLSLGEIDFNGYYIFNGATYNAVPELFSFAYKYIPTGADIAQVALNFYENGLLIGDFSTVLTATSGSEYETLTTALSIIGTPDSIQFSIYSGDNAGSTLLLDDFVLSGGNVGLEEFSTMNVSIYPNPATDVVFIKADGVYDFKVLDVAGNVIIENENINEATEINISQLTSGAYFVEINDGVSKQTHKLIKE